MAGPSIHPPKYGGDFVTWKNLMQVFFTTDFELTLRSGKTISEPNPNFSAVAQHNISRPFAASSSQNFQNFPANSEQPNSG